MSRCRPSCKACKHIFIGLMLNGMAPWIPMHVFFRRLGVEQDENTRILSLELFHRDDLLGSGEQLHWINGTGCRPLFCRQLVCSNVYQGWKFADLSCFFNCFLRFLQSPRNTFLLTTCPPGRCVLGRFVSLSMNAIITPCHPVLSLRRVLHVPGAEATI